MILKRNRRWKSFLPPNICSIPSVSGYGRAWQTVDSILASPPKRNVCCKSGSVGHWIIRTNIKRGWLRSGDCYQHWTISKWLYPGKTEEFRGSTSSRTDPSKSQTFHVISVMVRNLLLVNVGYFSHNGSERKGHLSNYADLSPSSLAHPQLECGISIACACAWLEMLGYSC